ncbi:SGNH/GDSL hydrolase family protein [Haloferula sp. BvORR071]|uniref:SGNH/GDSL hydrolase family protein n=1 Tax=Haloferula sp. BvORR071 TaxID=1396141 RepID=UPI0005536183|nr:SGNH/GDSL hydrolase family protein [Haloferula sp. BvORR071]
MRSLLLLLATVSLAHAEYALRDGDTLAFLGDSITAARGYTKVVEHYTLMRYPDRKVRFVNAGQGGDTANGCLQRLERDVFAKGATVVTVAFGINDIGWGTKADDEHKKLYLDGIRTIIARCKEKKVRPIICSPAITAEGPDTAEKGYLQTMTDEGLALANSLGAETIDLQRGMREVQRRVLDHNSKAKPEDQVKMHVKDGIHLEDLGQMAMAYAMIKGLGAPEDVSSATLDPGALKAETQGCAVSAIEAKDGGLSFTRLDQGLPVNFGPFTGLQYRWISIPEGINRYQLAVKNLPAGEYQITVDGRDVGKENAESLSRGVNIASKTGSGWFPGGPWDAQSCVVKELVDARDKLSEAKRLQGELLAVQGDAIPKEITKQDDLLVELQRQAAKPRPYHFTITPVK